MNKILKAALIGAGAVTAAAGAIALLTAPGTDNAHEKKKFYGRNVAHRGLHDRDGLVPENSLSAFRAAAEAGYGTELDVHLTADEQLVVFHDDNTGRMCGAELDVEESTLEELKALRLGGSEEQIPTLEEALEVVDGCGPIILELKRGKNNALLCEKALAAIDGYRGDLCVESFDPRIVAWFRKNAPDILRGQLTDSYSKMREGTSPLFAFLISHGLTNVMARPQFIAHGQGKKSPLIRLAEKMGAMSVTWTAHNAAAELSSDAVIFEHYKPFPKFK